MIKTIGEPVACETIQIALRLLERGVRTYRGCSDLGEDYVGVYSADCKRKVRFTAVTSCADRHTGEVRVTHTVVERTYRGSDWRTVEEGTERHTLLGADDPRAQRALEIIRAPKPTRPDSHGS